MALSYAFLSSMILLHWVASYVVVSRTHWLGFDYSTAISYWLGFFTLFQFGGIYLAGTHDVLSVEGGKAVPSHEG